MKQPSHTADGDQLMQSYREQTKLKMFAAMTERIPNAATGRLDPLPNDSHAYGDLPVVEPDDLDLLDHPSSNPGPPTPLEAACRGGSIEALRAILEAQKPTPARLHRGLVLALEEGSVDVVRLLLESGAPVVRSTPDSVLEAPVDRQTALFDLLLQSGRWTPNTHGYYGAVLLPLTVTHLPVLRWFLTHGADPNLGRQAYNNNRNGGPDTASCAALEAAAERGSAEAVQLLLDAGARLANGNPLHAAAGASSPGTSPESGEVVRPTRAFDEARIPVMAALVAAGADVNKQEETRHVTAEYPLVYTVLAGAVKRAEWLLQHGADPTLGGELGSAAEQAARIGTEEMKRVVLSGAVREAGQM